MTYEEALESTDITRSEAIAEVRAHQISLDEFFAEVGDKPHYSGAEVLNWLGY
tara:strand:+ start:613 stop:771 length:159 start_codon:yes stop_codon:yes gene_type:complete